jgi:hypothetical protein
MGPAGNKTLLQQAFAATDRGDGRLFVDPLADQGPTKLHTDFGNRLKGQSDRTRSASYDRRC